MKLLRNIGIFLLVSVMIVGMAACGDGGNETTPEITSIPETTPAPTTTAVQYPDAAIVATDSSPEEWKSKATYLCAGGEITAELKAAITKGGGQFKFAPGLYNIEGVTIFPGNNTVITGSNAIIQPEALDEMLYPDPATMAVFATKTVLPSTTQSSGAMGNVAIGAKNIVIQDVAFSGYIIMKMQNASEITINRVLIHNYNGTYPNGSWCNMGYGGANGSLWITDNCSNININYCQIQCSSHHGFLMHSAKNATMKDIHLVGVRALYCGCGQLMGQDSSAYKEAATRVPETKGFGYYDWSTAFDVCEQGIAINITLEDCYALEGWKAGFYTEPGETGGDITNLKLIGCRSDGAGRRALLLNPDKTYGTVFKEGEGANFYMQGGYFENCVSVDAIKAGWYLDPNRPKANATGDGKIQLVNCGDEGSFISLVTEMTDGLDLHSDGFFSLNAEDYAMWLFGNGGFKFTNTTILCENQKNIPVKIGYMLRMQFRFSRDYNNRLAIKPGGKYDVIRVQMTNCALTGTVYNLPESVSAAEIVTGSMWNGVADPNSSGSGITLSRDNTTQINVGDYVK